MAQSMVKVVVSNLDPTVTPEDILLLFGLETTPTAVEMAQEEENESFASFIIPKEILQDVMKMSGMTFKDREIFIAA